MNLEGITINILTSKLQEKAARRQNIQVFMPNKSSLLLLVKPKCVIPLAADFSGASPYLYMPDKTPDALKPRLLSACFCASIWKKGALPK